MGALSSAVPSWGLQVHLGCVRLSPACPCRCLHTALHAVTLGAAYQYFEEDTKGSITAGKQADLVILAKSPLETDPAELERIEVVETFSRGRSVYARRAN